MTFEDVTSLIRAVVWPVTVLLLAAVFRDSLRKLAGRLKSLEAPGGVKTTFSNAIEEVTVLSSEAADEVLSPATSERFPNELMDISPEMVVFGAWAQLSNVVGRERHRDEKGSGEPLPLMREIFEAARLPAEAVVAVDRLAVLRNRVKSGENITVKDANEFARATREMALLWQAKADRTPPASRIKLAWLDLGEGITKHWKDCWGEVEAPEVIANHFATNLGFKEILDRFNSLKSRAETASSAQLIDAYRFEREAREMPGRLDFVQEVIRDSIMQSEGHYDPKDYLIRPDAYVPE